MCWRLASRADLSTFPTITLTLDGTCTTIQVDYRPIRCPLSGLCIVRGYMLGLHPAAPYNPQPQRSHKAWYRCRTAYI